MSRTNTGMIFQKPNTKPDNTSQKPYCIKMVNGTVDAIEHLYRSWEKVILLRNNVRIPTPSPLNYQNYASGELNNVWEMMDRNGIRVIDKDMFLDIIKAHPERILDYPNDIFYVDDDTYSALPKYTGVMLLPNNSIPDKHWPLNRNWEGEYEKGQNLSWKNFLTRNGALNNTIPSNAMIIVDRYLFSSFIVGCKNLSGILDSILPDELNGVYHILLIIDECEIKKTPARSTDEAVLTIQKQVIDALRRPYPILFEVITINGNNCKCCYKESEKQAKRLYFDYTHDRKIISNYFVITATQGFAAVELNKSREQVSRYGQNIRFRGIDDGIDNEDQTETDCLPAEKLYRKMIGAIKDFLATDSDLCKFYSNGMLCSFKDIGNRLVRKRELIRF